MKKLFKFIILAFIAAAVYQNADSINIIHVVNGGAFVVFYAFYRFVKFWLGAVVEANAK